MEIEILNDVLVAVGITVGNVIEIHLSVDRGKHSVSARGFHILRAHDFRKGADRLPSRHESGIGVDQSKNGAVYRTEQGLKQHHFADRNNVFNCQKYAEEKAQAA